MGESGEALFGRKLSQADAGYTCRQATRAGTRATSTNTKTALLPAPFWCTERVDRTHFDWHWRERPALALLAWETGSDPWSRLRRIEAESI